MIISFDPSGKAILSDPDDFKRFKVVLEESQALPESDGVRLVEGHAHIDVPWLVSLAGPAATNAWRSSLDAMIEKARPIGWIDERGAIKAHIERA